MIYNNRCINIIIKHFKLYECYFKFQNIIIERQTSMKNNANSGVKH